MNVSETTLSIAEVIERWTAETDRYRAQNRERLTHSRAFNEAALHLLSQGRPVTVGQVAVVSGLAEDEVTAFFASVKARGGELDDQGRLVGLVLTLKPTPHRLHIDGRTLYAWCSLDTLFLPGLLGTTAVVTSTCPVSGREITLTVSPAGVAEVIPATTAAANVSPGKLTLLRRCSRSMPAAWVAAGISQCKYVTNWLHNFTLTAPYSSP